MARSSVLKPITLLASAARAGITKSVTDPALYGSEVSLREVIDRIQALALVLDVTAAATESGDKLDVTVQALMDRTNWVDICMFTQTLGNGGAVRHVAKLKADAALTMFTDAALTAGNIRDIWGEKLRVKYAITNDADDPVDTSFTFAVTAIPI